MINSHSYTVTHHQIITERAPKIDRSLTVFRIRFIWIWIRIQVLGSVWWDNGSGSFSRSDLNAENTNVFFYFFFLSKIYFSKKTICFVIKKKIIFSKKCMLFLWFWLIFEEIFQDFGGFFATRIRLTKIKRIRTRNTVTNVPIWRGTLDRWLPVGGKLGAHLRCKESCNVVEPY